MSLNIKNTEVTRIAEELSRATGENLTQTILHALQDRLAKIKGRKKSKSVYESLAEISERARALPDLDSRSTDEIIGYDAQGVPE